MAGGDLSPGNQADTPHRERTQNLRGSTAQCLFTRSVVVRPLWSPDIQGIGTQEAHVTPAPMALLSSGVPLSLLMDLVLGPNSEDLLSQEHLSDIRESYE